MKLERQARSGVEIHPHAVARFIGNVHRVIAYNRYRTVGHMIATHKSIGRAEHAFPQLFYKGRGQIHYALRTGEPTGLAVVVHLYFAERHLHRLSKVAGSDPANLLLS